MSSYISPYAWNKNIKKNRDIVLLTKFCITKVIVFPVVIPGCESWTIKKAEHWRNDAFELWYWRRLLSQLDSEEIKPVNPKGKQPWIFIGRTDAEAKAPIKFGHLIWSADLLEKTLILGKTDGKRRTGWQRMRWLDGITGSTDMSLSSGTWWWTGRPGMLQFMGLQRVRHDWANEQQPEKKTRILLEAGRFQGSTADRLPDSLYYLISSF